MVFFTHRRSLCDVECVKFLFEIVSFVTQIIDTFTVFTEGKKNSISYTVLRFEVNYRFINNTLSRDVFLADSSTSYTP